MKKYCLFLLLLVFGLLPLIVAAQETPLEPVDLRVMTFNIWVGGELVDFGKVVESIQAAQADVVGLQEATGNAPRLATALGWQYVSERTQIISRFPLIDPPGADGNYVYVQVNPGQVVAIANVHLTSDPYSPYAVRDGSTLEEVLQLERETRLPGIEPVLASLEKLIADGVPVFLTGDFNTPSHLDWTAAVMTTRAEVKYPVEWIVTKTVEAAGFVDTFRAIHPDPVENPGITWTYGYPYPRLKLDEVLDRIDLVFAANALEILDSQIVGPAGSPNVDIGITPFPSDHRGVVSTVRVLPVVPPLFVAVQNRRVMQGSEVVVRYHAPGGEDTDKIAIVPAAGDVDSALMWLPPYEASFFGSVTFGTGGLTPGEYAAILINSENEEMSRSPFHVLERDAVPLVRTDKTTYAPGETITVLWENTPGFRWDWVSIYSLNDPDLYNNYWGYVYTKAAIAGKGVFDAAVLGDEMLPPGDYVVRLLFDDGYQVLAETPFTVGE